VTLKVKLATVADVDSIGEVSLSFITDIEAGGATPFCCAEPMVPLQTETTASAIEAATAVEVLFPSLAEPRMDRSSISR
jgi:hypothetical protein